MSWSTKYPQHEKLRAVEEESHAIEEFLNHGLEEQGLCLAEQRTEDGTSLVPSMRPVKDILAEYFGIDQAALEREKRAMLADLRSRQVDHIEVEGAS